MQCSQSFSNWYLKSVVFLQGTRRISLSVNDIWVLLSNGYRGSFPGDKAAGAWSWTLTSISCRGQRMSGTIPPLSQYALKKSTGTC